MKYTCPWCDIKPRKMGDIKIHIREQHYWKDHFARWIKAE